MKRRELIEKKLEAIYGKGERTDKALELLESLLSSFQPLEPKEGLSEKDSMLITYADTILDEGEVPLATLGKFLKN